jgi:hypothetical protein
MEHRDRNQDPAYLYQRLGWTVRDRDSEAGDKKLAAKVEVELTEKKTKVPTALTRKSGG